MSRSAKPVRVEDVQIGDLVCTEDGKPLYTVESVVLRGVDERILEVRYPDGEVALRSWDREKFDHEVFVAVSKFRNRAILDGREYLPVGEVRTMALEVVRYLLSLEGALDPALVPHVDSALRESAYACLRSMTGVDEAALV